MSVRPSGGPFAPPEDQLRAAVATNLHNSSSEEGVGRGGMKEARGGGAEGEGGGIGNRKTGQDADICKRSDTDLEKATSSAWLVNRSVKLPRGSESVWEISSPLTQLVHFCC